MSCKSIHACKCSGRHIMAFEEDYAIFVAIVASCIVSTALAFAHVGRNASLDDDDDDGPIRKVVKRSRISK